MNRTQKFKIGYFVALLILATFAGTIVFVVGGNLISIVGIILILLAPGRIQGFYFRNFFIGRQFFDRGGFKQSIPYFEKFIVELNSRPHLKKLLWLSWSIYTPEIKSMALNNLGAAYLELGDLETAEKQFQSALSLDPDYPIPYFNLAIVNELRQEHVKARQSVEKASALGYKQSTLDKVINKSKSLLASFEGRPKNV